jgi:hypothetical protein
VSCEREGHVGAEDHHIQPKYRCMYCGAWGTEPSWFDDDEDDEGDSGVPRETSETQ